MEFLRQTGLSLVVACHTREILAAFASERSGAIGLLDQVEVARARCLGGESCSAVTFGALTTAQAGIVTPASFCARRPTGDAAHLLGLPRERRVCSI